MDLKFFFLEKIKKDINEVFRNDYGLYNTIIDGVIENNLYIVKCKFDEFIAIININFEKDDWLITIQDDKEIIKKYYDVLKNDIEFYDNILIKLYEMLKELGY